MGAVDYHLPSRHVNSPSNINAVIPSHVRLLCINGARSYVVFSQFDSDSYPIRQPTLINGLTDGVMYGVLLSEYLVSGEFRSIPSFPCLCFPHLS